MTMIIIGVSVIVLLIIAFVLYKGKDKQITNQQESIPKVDTPKQKDLPSCQYPPFSHARLIEMGLSDEESKEFVQELIPQLLTQISLIQNAIPLSDFKEIERLTHSIKGSATNLGTGGISDLLVEFNTYLKNDANMIDRDVVDTYLKYLIHYTQELEKEYS